MKKKPISVLLFLCAVLLTAGFAAHLCFDYTLHYAYGSSPFWLYVTVRFIEFMIPAVVCLACGMMMKKKVKKEKE